MGRDESTRQKTITNVDHDRHGECVWTHPGMDQKAVRSVGTQPSESKGMENQPTTHDRPTHVAMGGDNGDDKNYGECNVV